VALVYPVRKRLMTTWLASGHRFGVCVHYVVWFALFYGCGRVFPFFLLFLFVFFSVSFAASSDALFPGIPDLEPILM
jgi:hypothetical protein